MPLNIRIGAALYAHRVSRHRPPHRPLCAREYGRPIGNATLQGWEVGTQNRVNNAKKESRPIALAALRGGEQGRERYLTFSPFMRPNFFESNSSRFSSRFSSCLISGTKELGSNPAERKKKKEKKKNLTIPYKLKGTSRDGVNAIPIKIVIARPRESETTGGKKERRGGKSGTRRIEMPINWFSVQNKKKCRIIGWNGAD